MFPLKVHLIYYRHNSLHDANVFEEKTSFLLETKIIVIKTHFIHCGTKFYETFYQLWR